MRWLCLGLILVMFSLGVIPLVYAKSPMVTLDIDNIEVQDAVTMLLKLLQQNAIVSEEVRGVTSLHLHQMPVDAALDALLASEALSRWREGDVWFVGSSAAWLKHQEQEAKLQAATEAAATLVSRTWRLRYAKASDMAELIEDSKRIPSLLSNRGVMRVDKRTNTLFVLDAASRIATLAAFIKEIDVPVQQVLIEAKLASVDSDFAKELGIRFGEGEIASGGEATIGLPPTSGLAVATLGDGIAWRVHLSALEREGHGELISSPSLYTANQQTASIEAGEEIPYQEISRSGATGVSFRKAVLSLEVTPQIMPGRRILLQLRVNQDRPSERQVLGVPTINTHQIKTQVLVVSGQTVVLGGIYEVDHERSQDKVPLLGNIPVVGLLFRYNNTTHSKRELLIFVTPKIVSSG